MIPTIETIIEQLLDGTISKSQAVTWLHAHAEGVVDDLRDRFAGQALHDAASDYDRNDHKGDRLLAYAVSTVGTREEIIARQAYRYADAMLKARQS